MAEKEVSGEFPGFEVENSLLLGIEGETRCRGSWLSESQDMRVSKS